MKAGRSTYTTSYLPPNNATGKAFKLKCFQQLCVQIWFDKVLTLVPQEAVILSPSGLFLVDNRFGTQKNTS